MEMRRLPDEVIADFLSANYSVDPRDALAIAHNAEGNMIAAERNLSQSKEDKKFLDLFISLMRLAYQRKVKELKEWSNDVSGLGREQCMRFLGYSQRLLRENFIYNLKQPGLNYLNRDEAAFSVNFARFINERNVLRLVDEMNRAETDIAGNANAKIVLFDMTIKVILLLKS